MRHALAALSIFTAALLSASAAAAQDTAQDTRTAGLHFDRGVSLYGEADYAGALAEFERAYALAPNATVLFNVGEAEYQMQDYAGALITFTRYLAEAPPGAAHRQDVEGDIEVLRGRVGHLKVTTVPAGADVDVDDRPAGRTPLGGRLLVSVGHRKVTASLPGGPVVTRYVDVAADDDVAIAIQLPAAEPPPAPAAPPAPPRAKPPTRAGYGHALRVAGWITTGLVATGAAGAGVVAVLESGRLARARDTFPVSAATLQQDAAKTTTYSILADSLATAAAVLGGVTLVATLTAPSARAPETTASVRLTPASVDLALSF